MVLHLGMRVVLIAVGTHGSFNPFVAVAKDLLALGLDAVIAAPEACRALCERERVPFRPVRPSMEQIVADTGLNEEAVTRAMFSSWKFVLQKVVVPYAHETFEDLAGILNGADLAITSNASILGRIAAEAAHVKHMSILLQPMALSSEWDPPVFGSLAFLPSLRHRLGRWSVRPFIGLIESASQRILAPMSKLRALAGAPTFTGNEAREGPLSSEAVFALYSPAWAPLPQSAPSHVIAAGFSYYDGGRTMCLGNGPLQAFLDSGDAPLVFTLGTFAVYAEDGFFERSAEAVRRLGCRAVFLVGHGQAEKYGKLGGVGTFVSEYVPHSSLFPKARAVIHHGGVGTIAQAMRAGAPQLVCPRYGDQFDNAARICRVGLGRQLSYDKYDGLRAALAIQQLLSSDQIAAQTGRVAAAVASENGPAVIAQHVQRYLEAV